jgi:hypothetical protein
LWTWGKIGEKESSLNPSPVPFPSAVVSFKLNFSGQLKVKKVAVGFTHAIAVTGLDTVEQFHRFFQKMVHFIPGEKTPKVVWDTLMVKYYQQSNIITFCQSSETPRLIKTKPISKISCGSFHSAAITEKGELYTWFNQKMNKFIFEGVTVNQDAWVMEIVSTKQLLVL